jgi:hypothetical protein
MPSPENRVVRQLRHDVDDVYDLLNDTNTAVTTTNNVVTKMSGVQRRQGLRLEEIQQALDLQNGRLDRIEDTQRQIIDLLRGRQADTAEQ